VKPSPSAAAVLADPAYRRLKDHVVAATGLAYYADKDADLAGRLAQRLDRVGLADCGRYLAVLEDGARGEAELDALITDLTIGETFFFRHREMFDALRTTVLPDLIARNEASRQLRIWSAGCATGAEPYSLAILLRRDLAARLAGWDVTIVGTDINRDFLARARAGQFEEWAFRATPDDVKRACFEAAGMAWRIRPEYQDGVAFQYHNLVTHPFPSLLNNLFAFDLILCRNVTIYFNLDIVRRLIGHFHQSLVAGGWLLVGHAEPNMELFREFRTVNPPGAVLYQKSHAPSTGVPWLPLPSTPLETYPGVASAPQAWVPPVLPWLGESAPATPGHGAFDRMVPDVRPNAPPSAPVPAPRSELEMVKALADRGEWEQAVRRCESLLTRDKLSPTTYFYQALVLEQMGRHAEAENALRRAIYLDRQFILAHYYLGLLLQKQANLPQAVRAFKNVRQLLVGTPPDLVFADGDGITAAELDQLTHMHLEVLESP
jgi:chemotaxis protein methyltransferase CheR